MMSMLVMSTYQRMMDDMSHGATTNYSINHVYNGKVFSGPEQFPLILREVAASGVPLKACKSQARKSTGTRLSNTSIICLTVWDILGKLRLNPDKNYALEGRCFQK